jgi:hypothetical protein
MMIIREDGILIQLLSVQTLFMSLFFKTQCPRTSSIDWAQQSRLLLEDRDRMQSLKHCILKNRALTVSKNSLTV